MLLPVRFLRSDPAPVFQNEVASSQIPFESLRDCSCSPVASVRYRPYIGPFIRTFGGRRKKGFTVAEDRIYISDLLVRGIVGVSDWERKDRQDILVNIVLFADLRAAARCDNLEESVNYRTVSKQVIGLIESASRFTLEALAEDVAQLCLSTLGVTKARVRLEKPGAIRFARSVGVEIEREREPRA